RRDRRRSGWRLRRREFRRDIQLRRASGGDEHTHQKRCSKRPHSSAIVGPESIQSKVCSITARTDSLPQTTWVNISPVMKNILARGVSFLLVLGFIATPVWATCGGGGGGGGGGMSGNGGGGGNPTVYFVPWKIADPAKPVTSGL